MQAFRTAAEEKDVEAVRRLLAEDVVLRSPIVYAPYCGKETVLALLATVAQVLQELRYVRELRNDETRDHALVFKARVGERELEGCDFLHLNEEGLIDELFVMVRPLSAAHALRDEMTARIAHVGEAPA
jgi:hypothetical protein